MLLLLRLHSLLLPSWCLLQQWCQRIWLLLEAKLLLLCLAMLIFNGTQETYLSKDMAGQLKLAGSRLQ